MKTNEKLKKFATAIGSVLLMSSGAVLADATAKATVFAGTGGGGITPSAPLEYTINPGQTKDIMFGIGNSAVTPHVLFSYTWNATIIGPDVASVVARLAGEAGRGFDGPPTIVFNPDTQNPGTWVISATNQLNGGVCDATGPKQPYLEQFEGVGVYGFRFKGEKVGDYIIRTTSVPTFECTDSGAVQPLIAGDTPQDVIIHVVEPAPAVSVPTVNEWGLMILSMLLAIGAMLYRRKQTSV